MKIYTKGGDGGDTTLFGGVRVPKTDQRVKTYGTVDELNAFLGLALAELHAASGPEGTAPGFEDDVSPELLNIQQDLFVIGARLAAANRERAERKGLIPELPESRIGNLEEWIDKAEADLPPLEAFVLPGGSRASAILHVARTVCRRAERHVVSLLAEEADLRDVVLPYLNRLSDLIFVMARTVLHRAGGEDTTWLPQRLKGG